MSAKFSLSQAIRRPLQTMKNLQQRFDTVSITSGAQRNADKNEAIIYRPNGNQMRSLFPDGISYTQAAPDAKLQMEITPPSEKSNYTEQDALINQYMKQYRIEGRIEGDSFIRDSNDPVRLMLPEMVSDEELVAFQQKLSQNGLGDEIDWQGVSNDFVQMGVGLDNAEKLGDKVNYLTSRYAVLKNQIDASYTGEDHTTQMDTLNSIFKNAKEQMANTYAKEIGGFYEDMGQSGAAEDMRSSVLSLIDEKATAYESHLTNTDIYRDIKSGEKQWLVQDDAYMAARLRESMTSTEQSEKTTSSKDIYSANDLMLAGSYARTLTSQLHTAGDTWYNSTDDNNLGKSLAAQNREVHDTLGGAAVSDKMGKLMKDTFKPFMEKLMDTLDQRISEQKSLVSSNGWMRGTVRTASIDRKTVYEAYQTAMQANNL